MNQSFASQSVVAPEAVFFSRVVTLPDGIGDQRISGMVRTRADGTVEVGLHNHAGAVQNGNAKSTLGFELPAGANGEEFADDLLAAYASPPRTTEAVLFGWFYTAMAKHRAEYSEIVDAAFLAHLRETGEVSPENDRDDGAAPATDRGVN